MKRREIEAKSEVYNGSKRASSFGKGSDRYGDTTPGNGLSRSRERVGWKRNGSGVQNVSRMLRHAKDGLPGREMLPRSMDKPGGHNAKPMPSGKSGAGCQGRQVLRHGSGRMTERAERNAFGQDEPGEAIETR